MKCFFRSIIACICGLTIVFSSAVPPAFARDGVIGDVVDGVQSFTEWGENNLNNFWKVIFGPDFNSASEEELKAAYNDYVETLPAQGYDSNGGLLWSPQYAGVNVRGYNGPNRYCSHISTETCPSVNESYIERDKAKLNDGSTYSCGCYGNGHFQISRVDLTTSVDCSDFYYYFLGTAPVSGNYTLLSGPGGRVSWGLHGGVYSESSKDFSEGKTVFYARSGKILCSFGIHLDRYASFSVLSADCNLPVYKVVPSATLSGDTYSTTTRPTSITGGNYGIVGDNGQITKVEDNSTIINETNNTFYNPATGTTVPIVNWSYDYSDRSYKVTLESGDTATITYGDENITISQITTTEGDTITNNYTIYYLVDGSGSATPPCVHDWQETNTTPATCTVPGSKLSTCSKCQQTKKDPLPALGHDWQVKQTVTTEYDDTGQLIQQGYTIFECSRCHEQYKSSDGTIPPGGGSGTDPGGDEGETIWDKLGNLIGAIGSGVIGLIEAALGKVLDALIALVEGMMERLKTVVEAVLSIFDELPKLFGGFLDFLVAVFPFLPPELMTILTFGILAVVFIGIIKAVRR